MKKCKKKKYETGGPLDSILPMLPTTLGLVNPVLGTAASIGLKMSQQQESVSQPQSVVNSNPYGFALGGELDPPKKKTARYKAALGEVSQDNLSEALTTMSKFKKLQASGYSSIGNTGKAASALNASKVLKPLGPIVSAIEVGANLADDNYIRAGFSTVPFLPNALDYATDKTWDSKEANSVVKEAFQSIPELSKTLVDHIKNQFKLGGTLKGNEDLLVASGRSHAQGGINVSPDGLPVQNSNQEIEGDETILTVGKKKYVFSSKLTI